MSRSKASLAVRLAGALSSAVLSSGALSSGVLALGGLAASPAAAQAIRGHGDPTAEAYVQQEAGRALQILNDRGLAPDARKHAFYDFVNQVADVPRITNFVLGRYRRQISPAQYAQFADVFREYADSVYETHLGDYHGEGLKVTGSVQRAPGDVVVSSTIVGGSYQGQPVVNWRLIRGDAGWKVVDVQAQGVWLAVVEQQDFTSTLANANGNVEVLIAQLRRQAESAGQRYR